MKQKRIKKISSKKNFREQCSYLNADKIDINTTLYISRWYKYGKFLHKGKIFSFEWIHPQHIYEQKCAVDSYYSDMNMNKSPFERQDIYKDYLKTSDIEIPCYFNVVRYKSDKIIEVCFPFTMRSYEDLKNLIKLLKIFMDDPSKFNQTFKDYTYNKSTYNAESIY